jgi:signal peptidase I
MENTLFAEDIIVVNKLSYGPKIPQSIAEIPWIGLLFSESERTPWKRKRLAGIKSIDHGEVIVFQQSNGRFAVKRCVGIANDKFQIKEGIIYINGQKYEESENTKKRYRVHVSNPETFYQELKTLPSKVTADPVRNKATVFEVYLTPEEYTKVHQFTSVQKINILSDAVYRSYVGHIRYYDDWKRNNLGPVIIPKKGMQIRWNTTLFQRYKETLKEYENVTVTQKDAQFYVNGILSKEYIFQKDYLFVIGDNRRDSKDSRHYGFVPQERVVGKVNYIVYSNYNGAFQWNRLFKKVHGNPQRK